MLFDGILHRDKVENYIQRVIDSIDKPFSEKLTIFKHIENVLEGFSEQDIEDILNNQFLKYETAMRENQPRKEYVMKPKREIKPKQRSILSDEEDSKTTGENTSENTEESQEKVVKPPKGKRAVSSKTKPKKSNIAKENLVEEQEIRDDEILNIVEEDNKLKILESSNKIEEEEEF